MYDGNSQPITTDGNSLVLNDEYVGNDSSAYVKLTVTNTDDDDTAEYSRIIEVPAEYTRANTISFDTSNNPKGEISVASKGKTYTDGLAYAKAGGVFTVNDGANTGYKANVTVTDEDGNTIRKNDDGTYTMPESNVTVSVSYVKNRTYGTTRIAAINSASIKADGAVAGNGSNITIGAGRLAFLKFDLSGYDEKAISSAVLSVSADNTGNRVSTAIFYVPNNKWTEKSGLSTTFCAVKDDTVTQLNNFNNVNLFNYTTTYKDVAPEVTEVMLQKSNGEADLSSAANGALKDYFLGSYGAALSLDVTSAIKEALKRNANDNNDGIITLMVYSPRTTGFDIKSVTNASQLSARPSLTITETASALPDDALITEINTVQDLEELAQFVSGGKDYAGKTVTLKEDIDLSEKYNEDGESWTPIGTYDSELGMQSFAGTFEGGNHTISGLYINEAGIAQGLFGAVSGTVKNLTVDGDINGSSIIGGIAGYCSGRITDCKSSVNITAEREAGGIVGTLTNGGSVSGCDNSGDIEIKDKESYAGGIAAHIIGGKVQNCNNTGAVKNGVNGFRNRLGGITGYLDNYGEVINCYNTGSVKSETDYSTYVADETQNYVGGIAGYSQCGTITGCHNTGSVYNAVDFAGGIAGYLHSGDTVSLSYNDGDVSGKSYVGGIAGSNYSQISNCYNTGAVKGTGRYIGGSVGYLSTGSIENCHNIGKVSGEKNVGGIIGFKASGSVSGCYYQSDTSEGGIDGTDKSNSAEGKTPSEFASGSVAYLLQGGQPEQVWGQCVIGDNTDSYPVLTADAEKHIYKVTFSIADTENEGQYKEYAAKFTNAGGKVALPEEPYAMVSWSTVAEDNSDSINFTSDTVVNGDITVYATEEMTSTLSTDTAIWAQDIIDRATVTRGTDGNNSADNIGVIKDSVTDEQLAILGLFLDDNAVKGKTIGSKVRLNSLDALTNATDAAKWNGYIEDTISTSKAGTYDIYLIGTGADDRNFAITVNNSKTVETTSATNLTERVAAHLYSAQLELNAGANKIHIQAPNGKSAPNFIAMYVTKHPDEAERILPAAEEGEIKDTVGFTHRFDGNANSVVWHVSNGINTAKVNVDIPVITGAGETIIGLIITDIPDTVADRMTATVVVR